MTAFALAVKLPDAVRLREVGVAKEDGKLSDFQEILVQMAAILNGDHHKEIYPDKLVENMTVAEAATYTSDAYDAFCDACNKARERGADGSEIIILSTLAATGTRTSTAPNTLLQKILSCIICDN